MARAGPFRFDRSWTFGVDPSDLWAVISRPEDFPRWWSWLDSFEADGLEPGSRASFNVKAPLGYSLHFDLIIERVAPGAEIEASVDGDLAGSARLELQPVGRDTRAHLCWTLEPRSRSIVVAAIIARPLLVWSHERIVDLGVRQFEERALNPRRRRSP
jgi:uncharacterized membrane protein